MASWGYGTDNGPAVWYKDYPAGRGMQQSPIDLRPSLSVFDSTLAERGLVMNYDGAVAKRVLNNGKSVTVSYDGESCLKGGPLTGEFKLAQFHFHWGSDNNCGSEHTLDGKVFPAEAHLVHYNTRYGTFGDAADKPDGLCVLGSFIEPGSENAGIAKLFSLLPKSCQCKDQEANLDGNPVDPTALLPASREFLTYRGSLTTPPLFESVQWVNFVHPIQFSQAQLDTLRNLSTSSSGDGPKMVNNYRPPCPLLNRCVTANYRA